MAVVVVAVVINYTPHFLSFHEPWEHTRNFFKRKKEENKQKINTKLPKKCFHLSPCSFFYITPKKVALNKIIPS